MIVWELREITPQVKPKVGKVLWAKHILLQTWTQESLGKNRNNWGMQTYINEQAWKTVPNKDLLGKKGQKTE